MRHVLGMFAGAVTALAAGFSAVSADGEVGVVIQIGSEVETYCVAYTGESVTGEQALGLAGKSLEQFGGTGGRTVCAIDDVGCDDASTFSSCFCECQGRECTYWAFFTREYGANWVYSTLAFNLLKATDGDVHGWKWGAGGPSSAPAPADVTFEQICGHAPASTLPPTPTSVPPTAIPTVATAAPASATPTTAGTPATAGSVATAVTVGTATRTAAPATEEVTLANTPEAPPTGDDANDETGGNGGLIAAGAIGAVLATAIGGAAVWRSRRGA